MGKNRELVLAVHAKINGCSLIFLAKGQHFQDTNKMAPQKKKLA